MKRTGSFIPSFKDTFKVLKSMQHSEAERSSSDVIGIMLTRLTEDKMVGWRHQLDGHEFEQALGVGDGQGSLACCSPWGCKESDMTERLN